MPIIGNHGTPTSETCPGCGGKIVYNGNYFCENWGDTCEWALPHPQVERADQEIAYRLMGYWEEELENTGQIIQLP